MAHSETLINDAPTGSSKLRQFINRAEFSLDGIGLGFLLPLLRIAAGDNIREQAQELKQRVLVPLLGIALFLLAWASFAPMFNTSLGAIPGPAQVMEQAGVLINDHYRERNKEVAFYERLEVRNEKLRASGDADKIKVRAYTGKPTYFDQVGTSLITVALGFSSPASSPFPWALPLACRRRSTVRSTPSFNCSSPSHRLPGYPSSP